MYQKANPRADINARARDQFWAKQEVSIHSRQHTREPGVCVSACVCVCRKKKNTARFKTKGRMQRNGKELNCSADNARYIATHSLY